MKVGIVGVGLIGGSTALALSQRGNQLFLDDANAATRTLLRQAGIGTVAPYAHWIGKVDAVVLAVPLGRMAETVLQVVPGMRRDASLVDMSSVKVPIAHHLKWAASLVRVMSLHLMAGREVNGFSQASANLFDGCAAAAMDIGAGFPSAEQLRWWQENLQCGTFALWDAGRHDAAMVWVSQMPYLVSRAIAHVVEHEAGDALVMAGPGYRDTTRVGRASWELMSPMLTNSKVELTRALLALESQLGEWRECLNRPEGPTRLFQEGS